MPEWLRFAIDSGLPDPIVPSTGPVTRWYHPIDPDSISAFEEPTRMNAADVLEAEVAPESTDDDKPTSTRSSTASAWSYCRWAPSRPGSPSNSELTRSNRSRKLRNWESPITELLFRLSSQPNLQRRPDAAFVSFERWPKGRRIPVRKRLGRHPRSGHRGRQPDQPGRGDPHQGPRVLRGGRPAGVGDLSSTSRWSMSTTRPARSGFLVGKMSLMAAR